MIVGACARGRFARVARGSLYYAGLARGPNAPNVVPAVNTGLGETRNVPEVDPRGAVDNDGTSPPPVTP